MSRSAILSMKNRRLKKMPQLASAPPLGPYRNLAQRLAPGDPSATNTATLPGPNGIGNTIETNTNYTMGQEDRVVVVVQNAATIVLPTEPLLGYPIYIVADGGPVTVTGSIQGGNPTLNQGTIGVFSYSAISGEWSTLTPGTDESSILDSIPNIAALRATIGKTGSQVSVGGYYVPADDGGGTFYWNPEISTGDNGGTIIVPTGSTSGRWERVSNEPLNVKWFGAYGDGEHDDTAALQSVINAAAIILGEPLSYVVGGNRVVFPPGIYNISSDIVIPAGLGGPGTNLNPANIFLEGAGRQSTFVLATVPGVNCFSQQYAQDVTVMSNWSISDMTLAFNGTITQWNANHSYSVGAIVTSGCSPVIMVCTGSGTSGATAPYGTMTSYLSTDPTVRLSGTPNASYAQIVIGIEVTGVLGAAEFQYSTDGGQTFNGSNIVTGPSVALGATGLTAHFSTGDYANAFTALNGPGVYASPQLGYAFSTVIGDVIVDGTVTWTVMGGSGILQLDGDQITVERVNFVNQPVGLILNGTETSAVDDCNFLSINGVWITGNGANGIYVHDCNFSCQQICYSVTSGTGHELSGPNFEGGLWAVWLGNAECVTVTNATSEGITNALAFIGSYTPYTGRHSEPSFNVSFNECELNSSAGSSPYGNTFQFIPDVNAISFSPVTPYEHVAVNNSQLYTGNVVFLGAEQGNGLRLTDVLISVGETSWFNNGTPHWFVYEESGNAGSGVSQIGLGVVPATNIDTPGGIASRANTPTVSNGINNNVTCGVSYLEITGPTSSFSITGLTGGTNGLVLDLYNLSGQTMTLSNESATSTAANRIHSPTGSNVTCTAAHLRYSTSQSRWLIISYT